VVPPDPWGNAGQRLAWGREGFGDRWLLLTGLERALVDRLAATCRRLDDAVHTSAIFTGLQTSADDIYHLKRRGAGQYLSSPPGKPRPAAYQVEIEDAVMWPLVSGVDAKRYCDPRTDTWLLFPYQPSDDGRMELIDIGAGSNEFPKARAYLQSYRSTLEMREAKRDKDGTITGPVYDERYYRYVYPKSLDKHSLPKLIIPRLVAHLGCIVDEEGAYYLDNVDVGGVLAAEGEDLWFLAGILNAPVADWVFRRISKPFRGDYLSANKQFIAPLPIPPATAGQRATVAADARELQRLHTLRRDLLARIARRLGTVARRARRFSWLFAGLAEAEAREARMPAGLDAAERRARARAAYEADLATRCQALGAAVRPGAALDAALADGELRFLADGVAVLDRVFVTAGEGAFVLAQWRVVASTFEVTERTGGKKLAALLRTLAVADNPVVVEQVVVATAELAACEGDTGAVEARLDELTFQLYGLTQGERGLIAAG
jgi:hypothetical protein